LTFTERKNRVVRVVSAPGPDAVNEAEENAERDAQAAHHDVGDAQERVLAAEPADGGQHHVLLAVELGRGII
jgi:predicted transcriptional regulator